jgi:hypothetical protein
MENLSLIIQTKSGENGFWIDLPQHFPIMGQTQVKIQGFARSAAVYRVALKHLEGRVGAWSNEVAFIPAPVVTPPVEPPPVAALPVPVIDSITSEDGDTLIIAFHLPG